MNDQTTHVRDVYRALTARHRGAAEAADRRSLRLANLRAATFLGAFGCWVAWDVLEGIAAAVLLALAGALAGFFAALVVIHGRTSARERRERALAGVYHEGTLRLDRAWEALEAALPAAERSEDPVPADHPYARDLDVTGRASLVRLMGPVTSERGRRLLRSWLLSPAGAGQAAARQGAVRELAPLTELRASLAAAGRLEGPAALDGIGTFLGWAEEEPWILPRRGLRVAAWVLPALLVGAVLADVLAGARPFWLLVLAAGIFVHRRVRAHTAQGFARAEAGGGPLRSIVPQLLLLEERSWSDPLLVSIGARLGRGEEAAHRHLGRLSRVLDTAESRRNMIFAALSPLLLLDVHLGLRLDRWRARHGRAVRDWLEAMGEWEALAALATLAHDHPDWCFPALAAGPAPELVATDLGHPLLPDERCVRNDVRVGPPATFLLVTGSNMSGKSTLLRALGANAVLASAGGPACASALRLPALRVQTSARIDDSLVAGISLFMAELLRIRQVVDAAGAADPEGRPVLYLLDEILHGTNTAERRIAARGVVRHLLAAGAIGAVSTHDLTLADAPDLDRAAVKVHFREQVEPDGSGGTRLTFDYRLRDGLATTRNALKLLEAVGLGGLALEGEEGPVGRPSG